MMQRAENFVILRRKPVEVRADYIRLKNEDASGFFF